MEDVAIAYGYNNLVNTVPKTVTAGKELPLNQARPVQGGRAGGVRVEERPVGARRLAAPTPLDRQAAHAHAPAIPALPPPVPLQMCELLRMECAMAGFTEILTWALCSHAENFEQLRRQVSCSGRFGGDCGSAWPALLCL